MALIKRADLDKFARDAIVLNLGDIAREGEQIKAKAEEKAAGFISEGKLARDQIRSSAAQQGRVEGYAKGMLDGRNDGTEEGKAEAKVEYAQKLELLESSWRAALADFEQIRASMLTEARQDVLRLALMVAEKVTKKVIEIDSQIVCGQMEAVLSLLANPTKLTIAVHPEDEKIGTEFLPDLVKQCTNALHAELVTDDSLRPGSCVVRTGAGGMIDASIDTQLDRIVQALLPGAAANEADAGVKIPPPESLEEGSE